MDNRSRKIGNSLFSPSSSPRPVCPVRPVRPLPHLLTSVGFLQLGGVGGEKVIHRSVRKVPPRRKTNRQGTGKEIKYPRLKDTLVGDKHAAMPTGACGRVPPTMGNSKPAHPQMVK
ncbi:hypothetical protein IQ235_09325 [Oscillatoriales cyanobacterium LEGE 11467]|uniref:Uncharacterized protein n=1 Tax=Zarconia navalis LEGE 11467 TaxID=1828826 RepID=A0A928W0D7_9CYAN|nr:hypothetical protein [Zarconia navalis]MBE9040980.1 hypothetical protein [Zarconia navalis LEGE 11467]